jgi:glycosyltransferase involved in cell wall biosynthesis
MTPTQARQSGPLVTVLISTYNRPRYLAQALASVFRQTWQHFEVILVRDGGAPVREAIAEYLDDSRLTFIDRDKNFGKPYSLNEALQQARGEYICYLDDDDLFYPFHIETLVNAIERQDRCQAVYSDLYKTHCRLMPDGRRQVLAKNVEISRDFDRMLMLQFNHVLHVSLLHRRDLLARTGGYNENLNILIDWDLTRRLCFYTDFLHVPIVTGEFYAPVGQCDRISVQRRKNVNEYLWNLMAIRSTRPPKPWPCMRDLSMVVLGSDGPALARFIRDIWSHSFYPAQFLVPLAPSERNGFSSAVPNVKVVPVPEDTPSHNRIDKAIEVCQADFTAIIPCGIAVPSDESAFVERSLNPLLNNDRQSIAYELAESTPEYWGGVLPTSVLRSARRAHSHLPLKESLLAHHLEIRKPFLEEYPFQFDLALGVARQYEREGQWGDAARLYDFAARHYGNTLWVQTLKANALYHQSRWESAASLAEDLCRTAPTVARLLIAARARGKLNDFNAAAALYRRAEAILEGTDPHDPQGRQNPAVEKSALLSKAAPRPQESFVWMS